MVRQEECTHTYCTIKNKMTVVGVNPRYTDPLDQTLALNVQPPVTDARGGAMHDSSGGFVPPDYFARRHSLTGVIKVSAVTVMY
jgi:hypothetical protein